ncbi:hypothetical protein PR202_gb28452 [Eleusine coracana subsp. coracana]|uniref:DUF8204 domain-containing protein n=1 Tax=Eleusine coracana subsp. coracana TaxID=191504 RepID=A0AAV5FWE9_ELECO|nr:hypothetical protein PR202_gb28452 [Eleusine coracana subsp. coracana]
MERGSGEAGAPTAAEAAAATAAAGGALVKGKSCKGCLYFSSVLRSRARGPVCVGVTRAIPEVPERMIGEIELEAIQEGRNLSDFRYACVGYSIYLDDKENPVGKREKRLLADRRAAPNKEASPYLKKDAPQPRRYKPGHAGDHFLTKFQRNAGLVANGVAKNLNKVGTYIKDTIGDMNPYQRIDEEGT